MNSSRSFDFAPRWMPLVFSMAFIFLMWIFNLEFWIATPAWILALLPVVIVRIVGTTTDENQVSGRKFIYIFVIVCLIVLGIVCWQLGVLGREGMGQGGGIGEGENKESEKVLFRYEASFQYLGSEENLTLEGYYILFPCPTVDGKPVFRDESLNYKYGKSEVENFYWQLWGLVKGENAAWLEKEVDNGRVLQWVGERAKSPPNNDFYVNFKPFHTPDKGFIEQYEQYGVNWKILLQNGLDNLYLGEKLESISHFYLPVRDEGKVTLQEDNKSVRNKLGKVIAAKVVGYIGLNEPIRVNLSFQSELFKNVKGKWFSVESYKFEGENVLSWGSGWLELNS